MPLDIQTSQNVVLQYEPASIGDRILANIIDWIIYFLWLLAMVAIMSRLPGYAANTFFQVGFIFIPIALYPLLTEYFLDGQTLGKKALKVKVVTLDGNKPTLGAYLMRWLLAIIDCFPFTPVVGIVSIVINGKGQRLGDMAAGTAVIKLGNKVTLSDVLYTETPANYRVTYPDALNLSDQDMDTIRRVLQKNNLELTNFTAAHVGNLLNAPIQADSRAFLQTIVIDHAHLALKN